METRNVSEGLIDPSLTRILHQLECDVRSTAFRRNSIQPAKAGTTNGLYRLMQNTITLWVSFEL